MRIVVGTYYRTGSTWLYNAIRLSCIEAGLSVSHTGNTELIEYNTDVIIHKVHNHSQELEDAADHIFTIERDIREADASFLRAFKHPIDHIDRALSIGAARRWREAADRVFQFRDIAGDSMLIITSILHVLKLKKGSQFIIRVYDKLLQLQPPTEKIQDPESLYFCNHITSDGSHSSDSST